MPAAARLNDADTSDGQICGDVSTDVIINGQGAALEGSLDSSHAPYGAPHPPHQAATVATASSTVIANGKGIAFVGSDLSCGHAIAAGSPDVEIGS
jgi:uncharacterized Zn-binding protein involved in type VI secretion